MNYKIHKLYPWIRIRNDLRDDLKGSIKDGSIVYCKETKLSYKVVPSFNKQKSDILVLYPIGLNQKVQLTKKKKLILSGKARTDTRKSKKQLINWYSENINNNIVAVSPKLADKLGNRVKIKIGNKFEKYTVQSISPTEYSISEETLNYLMSDPEGLYLLNDTWKRLKLKSLKDKNVKVIKLVIKKKSRKPKKKKRKKGPLRDKKLHEDLNLLILDCIKDLEDAKSWKDVYEDFKPLKQYSRVKYYTKLEGIPKLKLAIADKIEQLGLPKMKLSILGYSLHEDEKNKDEKQFIIDSLSLVLSSSEFSVRKESNGEIWRELKSKKEIIGNLRK